MGEVILRMFEGWGAGVITSAEPDQILPTASPRGRNSVLLTPGGGDAVPAKRTGLTLQNPEPMTGSPVINGMFDFRRQIQGTTTLYHMLAGVNGRIDLLLPDGTLTPADPARPIPHTADVAAPFFSEANNLAFFSTGIFGDNLKFDGAAVTAWGLGAPTGAPTIAAGGAGAHNGTYEGRLTYLNSLTGNESSPSPTSTLVVVNKEILWSWALPTDPQVDRVRFYLRNTATQANFYLAGSAAVGAAQPASTSVADTSLITLGPSTPNSNDPPPTLSTHAWHQSRMFAAGPDNPSFLLYSNLGFPEQFNPLNFERVAQDDGQTITALHSAHQLLIIWKQNSMWVLIGDDPTSWVLRLVAPTIGCVSPHSVVTVEGKTYWWSEQGPVSWDGNSDPLLIGMPTLGPTVSFSNLNAAAIQNTRVAYDVNDQLVLWAVPLLGQDRNNCILPWSFRLSCWVSDGWETIDAASLVPVRDTIGRMWVYLGSYSGQVFKFDKTSYADGIPSGVVDHGTVTGATLTTVFDAAAAFPTTQGGLVDRYVTVISPDEAIVQRALITANTATGLTINPAWAVVPDSTWTYAIGLVNFEWDLREEDFDWPFWKKRLEFFYSQAKTSSAGAELVIFFFRNRERTASKIAIQSYGSAGAVYDDPTSLYDTSLYATEGTTTRRLRVGKTARTVRVRLCNCQPNVGIAILKAGFRVERLTDKLG